MFHYANVFKGANDRADTDNIVLDKGTKLLRTETRVAVVYDVQHYNELNSFAERYLQGTIKFTFL